MCSKRNREVSNCPDQLSQVADQHRQGEGKQQVIPAIEDIFTPPRIKIPTERQPQLFR
ncbi:hypothetical protein SL1157_0946 [Ruegeria lacuscaerulensis ITI-1157]|nr:hypothetical protein SL1157_0946 [Ruegeria lacuscaerulensis ITI-1157]